MSTKKSKRLAYILRHDPASANTTASEQGWVSVSDIMRALNVTMPQLQVIVSEDSKGRYEFSADNEMIRATQGHSYPVNLGWESVVPPAVLYHGTATRFVESIMREGLVKGSRQWVHLSADTATASMVGSRHGELVILEVAASRMAADGRSFYRSSNGVWMAEYVPVEYITTL